MKSYFNLVIFISLMLKIFAIYSLDTNNQMMVDKVDEILVENFKKKITNNESDDDITDSIKSLLSSDLDKPKDSKKESKNLKKDDKSVKNLEIEKLKNMHFLQVENKNKISQNNVNLPYKGNPGQNINQVNFPIVNVYPNQNIPNLKIVNPSVITNNPINVINSMNAMNQVENKNTISSTQINQVPINNFNNNNQNINNSQMNLQGKIDMPNKINQFNGDFNLNEDKPNKNSNKLNKNNSNNMKINSNNVDQVNFDLNNSEVIFSHVFINMDGQKYIPNTNNQIYFDENTGKVVLPEEIIKEDNITKMLRIKAILDSMDFDSQEFIESIQITDPPIIKGIEKIIPEMNKKENFSHERIDTKIIRSNADNKYFQEKDEMDKKIRTPPNFLMY